MAAITWRQLVGDSDTGAFRAIAGAADTVKAGFDAFNKVIADRQVANQFAYDKGQDAQAVAFREALAGATTEDQVKQIQAQRDTWLAGLDPTRRAALVGAEEARIGSVRAGVVAAQQHQDWRTLLDNRDPVNAALARAAQEKDPTAAIAMLPKGLPNEAELVKQIVAAAQGNAKTASELETASVSRKTSQQNADAATTNAAANTLNANTNAQSTAQNAVKELEARRADLTAKMGEANRGTFGSAEGQKSYEAAVKAGAGDKAPTIMRLAGEAVASDPKFRSLPTDVVSQIVLKHSADFGTGKWNLDWNVAGRIKDDLEKAYADPNVRLQMERAEASRLKLSVQLQGLDGVADGAMRKAYPEFGAQLDAATARQAAAAAPASPEVSAAAELQREGQRGSGAPEAGKAPAAVENFKLDPALEQKAEEQKLQMSLGTRRLFSPEVDKYLKAKDAAIAELNKAPEAGPNPAARFVAAPFSLSDQIVRRQQEDEARAKKAR